MPIKMRMDGLAQIEERLKKLGDNASRLASSGLYDGAGVMAEEIRKGAETIKTAPFHYAVFVTRQPSPEEKAAVLEAGAGIARFSKTGSEVNTSIGYRNSGYTTIKGKVKPIPKIVNAINSGTSFMKKQPFVRKAATSGAKKAEAAIIKTIEQKFEEYMDKK